VRVNGGEKQLGHLYHRLLAMVKRCGADWKPGFTGQMRGIPAFLAAGRVLCNPLQPIAHPVLFSRSGFWNSFPVCAPSRALWSLPFICKNQAPDRGGVAAKGLENCTNS
jgi:hypothetical protein